MITKKVQLNVYIPEAYRDTLQRLAGQRMLNDPRRSVTASKIGAEIICEYLDDVKGKGVLELDGGVQNE